jgi:hypothetical protein
MIGGEAESVQRRIASNNVIMGANQTWLKRSFFVAVLSPFAGFAAWLLASNLSC